MPTDLESFLICCAPQERRNTAQAEGAVILVRRSTAILIYGVCLQKNKITLEKKNPILSSRFERLYLCVNSFITIKTRDSSKKNYTVAAH